MIKAALERQRLEYRQVLFGAWHGAAYNRVKRLPGLRSVLQKLDGPKREGRSMGELLAMIKAMNASLGGRDLTKGAAADQKPKRPRTRRRRHG